MQNKLQVLCTWLFIADNQTSDSQPIDGEREGPPVYAKCGATAASAFLITIYWGAESKSISHVDGVSFN